MATFFRLKKTFLFLILLTTVLSVFTAFQSHMNNWLIFKASFQHLLAGTNLYIHYPEEHMDLFKYSPTFALFMAPLSYLPAWLGGTLWNVLGAILFIMALIQLPINDQQRKAVFWISLPEFIGSTQGFQSNIHVVSLLMLFWAYLEKEKPWSAALNLLASFFIKIFGILACCLFIFDRYSFKKPKIFAKHIIALMTVFIVLTLLPALFVGFDSLIFQYQQWGRLLKMDAAQSYGFSLMGFIHSLSGWNFNRLPWQVVGGLSLVLSFFYFRKSAQKGRLLGLIALCYFLIVFNHKSESPTFIIAMMAFGLHQSLIINQKLRWFLIVLTLTCVSVMYSDLFRQYRQTMMDAYVVKLWPFLILYPMAIFHVGIKDPSQNHLDPSDTSLADQR